MVGVFVSGCYDILRAGHLQFFEEARALGDHLTVSFANEAILRKHKERRPSLPDDHKAALLRSLGMVDEVVAGDGEAKGLDFEPIFTTAIVNRISGQREVPLRVDFGGARCAGACTGGGVL